MWRFCPQIQYHVKAPKGKAMTMFVRRYCSLVGGLELRRNRNQALWANWETCTRAETRLGIALRIARHSESRDARAAYQAPLRLATKVGCARQLRNAAVPYLFAIAVSVGARDARSLGTPHTAHHHLFSYLASTLPPTGQQGEPTPSSPLSSLVLAPFLAPLHWW